MTRNLPLCLWWTFLAACTISALIMGLSHAEPTFPYGTPGMCLDDAYRLAQEYPGQDVIYAYGHDHVWLIVGGQPIDTVWGYMPRTREWMFPERSSRSFHGLLVSIGSPYAEGYPA